MNKSILIITQYYSIGGLETYIDTQVKDLVAHGYQVHLMSAAALLQIVGGDKLIIPFC
ncbi:Uncharacterised protein [Serratia marcescens]|nr:Uncharacterised protein [Serratia marcescens]